VKPFELLGQTLSPDGSVLKLIRRSDEYIILVDGAILMSSCPAACTALSITEAEISAYRAHRLAQKNTQFPTVNRELAALKAAFRLGMKQDMACRVPDISIQNEQGRERDGEFNVGRGELRLSGRRTKTSQQKVLYLTGKGLEVLKAQRKLHDEKFPDQPIVFPDEEGQAIPYDRALDQFQAACKRAGISFATNEGTRLPGWHDLRRTFARMARRNGVPDKVNSRLQNARYAPAISGRSSGI
jgi:hypothetical protein